jgi:hypothetical protein
LCYVEWEKKHEEDQQGTALTFAAQLSQEKYATM